MTQETGISDETTSTENRSISEILQPKRKAGESCPVSSCGGKLEERGSKLGNNFLGCTNFFAEKPCRYTCRVA